MIEISWRCNDWPFERPDETEIIHESDELDVRNQLAAEGGCVTGSRIVGWQEMLARMENPEL